MSIALTNLFVRLSHIVVIDEKDAEFLRTVAKHDILSLFLSQVHPSSTTRAKLSVHMVSQKPRPKRVSRPAAEAFESLVRQAFPDLDEKARKPFVGDSEPTIVEFGQHWLKVLNSDQGKQLLPQLSRLVEEHPVDEDHDDRQITKVTYIEDMKTFKDSLKPSVDPGPMVEWNDLPVPRF